MKNKDEMLFANAIPTDSTHGKMVAKLVCETANLKKRINDLLKENTEWKLENNRLNNIINELEKYLNQEIIEWQDASDLWTKAQVQEDRIVLNKLKELKEK